MRPRLLDPDARFDPGALPPPWADDLVADLGLDLVLDAMADGDALVRAVARTVLVAPSPAPETVRHRQDVMADALRTPDVLRRVYDLLGQVLADARAVHGSFTRGPGPRLNRARKVLLTVLPPMRDLRDLLTTHASEWQSAGMGALVHDLTTELDDEFFADATEQLQLLELNDGVNARAALGPGLRPDGLSLVRPARDGRGWLARHLDPHPDELIYRLPDRDEAGARALSDLRDRALAEVADAVGQASEHVQEFCRTLRAQLAFYVGALALVDRLATALVPVCIPEIGPPGGPAALDATDLRDVALALAGERAVVGNALHTDDAPLLVITGANRGGKSTFLRSLGQAQVMADAGMVVAAEHLRVRWSRRVLTHFRREEDAELVSGKLTDELRRMARLVDHLRPGDLVLANESFASTNEREGSELARQVFEPLLDAGMRVALVTHLVELATGWAKAPPAPALFLRADPDSMAQRPFRLREGPPSDTSHGVELADRLLPA